MDYLFRLLGGIFRLVAGLATFLTIVVGIAVFANSSPAHQAEKLEHSASPVLPDKWPSDEIKLADMKWSGGYGGGLARATFTLVNTTDFAVRDVSVQCVYYGRSGSEISRHFKVVYERVEPGKKLRTKEIVFGFIDTQAATSGCQVLGYHKV